MWLAAAIGTLILSLEFHCNAGEIAGRAAEWVLHAQRTKTFRRSVPMKAGCAPATRHARCARGADEGVRPYTNRAWFQGKSPFQIHFRDHFMSVFVCFFVTAASIWP